MMCYAFEIGVKSIRLQSAFVIHIHCSDKPTSPTDGCSLCKRIYVCLCVHRLRRDDIDASSFSCCSTLSFAAFDLSNIHIHTHTTYIHYTGYICLFLQSVIQVVITYTMTLCNQIRVRHAFNQMRTICICSVKFRSHFPSASH